MSTANLASRQDLDMRSAHPSRARTVGADFCSGCPEGPGTSRDSCKGMLGEKLSNRGTLQIGVGTRNIDQWATVARGRGLGCVMCLAYRDAAANSETQSKSCRCCRSHKGPQKPTTYTQQRWSRGPIACGSFVTPKPGRKKERKMWMCVCVCVFVRGCGC